METHEQTSEVITERRGRILIITLNRPAVRNAVNAAMAAGVAAALDELDGDQEIALAIVTGAGGSFSSGLDLKAFLAGESPYAGDRGFAGITRRSARKPVIAAVEGFAVAGGFEIALACDLIVAARSAVLGIPEVKRALVAAGGALLHLPRRLPYHVAMEMALTGGLFPAERLHELGLINRLADRGAAVAAAVELAEQIIRNGPIAIEVSKEILQRAGDWGADEAWERQQAFVARVTDSEDAREGAVAFSEKREPVWCGR